jgi:N-methylhydantoinase A
METEDAVSGIVDIANVSMLRILRVISVARGYDPRDFVLFAYGGAGPLHAVELAEKLSVTHVVIPRFPGIFSSLGLLFADMSMDFVETVMTDLNDLDSINQALSALKEEAEKWFNRNQPEDKEREMDAAGDLRYLHQNYELNVQLPGFKVKKEDVSRIRDEFDKTHEKSYGHSAPGEPVQAVNIRVRAVIKIPKPRLPELEKSNQAPEPSGRRKVRFGKEWIETAVYERKQLCSGQKIDGPSVIEETESTTLVGPGWRMEVDKWGHMHLKKSEK